MGYFQVRYDSRVVIYDHKMFIRLATALLSLLLLLLLRQAIFYLNKLMKRFVDLISLRESNQSKLANGDLKSNIFVGRPLSINFPSHVMGLSTLSSEAPSVTASSVTSSDVVEVVVVVVVVVVVGATSVVLKRDPSSNTLKGRPFDTNLMSGRMISFWAAGRSKFLMASENDVDGASLESLTSLTSSSLATSSSL